MIYLRLIGSFHSDLTVKWVKIEHRQMFWSHTKLLSLPDCRKKLIAHKAIVIHELDSPGVSIKIFAYFFAATFGWSSFALGRYFCTNLKSFNGTFNRCNFHDRKNLDWDAFRRSWRLVVKSILRRTKLKFDESSDFVISILNKLNKQTFGSSQLPLKTQNVYGKATTERRSARRRVNFSV